MIRNVVIYGLLIPRPNLLRIFYTDNQHDKFAKITFGRTNYTPRSTGESG